MHINAKNCIFLHWNVELAGKFGSFLVLRSPSNVKQKKKGETKPRPQHNSYPTMPSATPRNTLKFALIDIPCLVEVYVLSRI